MCDGGGELASAGDSVLMVVAGSLGMVHGFALGDPAGGLAFLEAMASVGEVDGAGDVSTQRQKNLKQTAKLLLGTDPCDHPAECFKNLQKQHFNGPIRTNEVPSIWNIRTNNAEF